MQCHGADAEGVVFPFAFAFHVMQLVFSECRGWDISVVLQKLLVGGLRLGTSRPTVRDWGVVSLLFAGEWMTDLMILWLLRRFRKLGSYRVEVGCWRCCS